MHIPSSLDAKPGFCLEHLRGYVVSEMLKIHSNESGDRVQYRDPYEHIHPGQPEAALV